MNDRPEPYAPAHYELRIEGHLNEHWSAWFGRLTVNPEDDGTTTLRGPVTDQAELHGLLAKVRDLGITLISVISIDSAHDPDSREPQQERISCPPQLPHHPPSIPICR